MKHHSDPARAESIANVFAGDELALQAEQLRIAGASVAIYHDGQYSESVTGFANAPAGIEVDSHTIFQIGSITKVFTATLMMKLIEQGLLSLDTPVGEVLPEFRVGGQPPPESMTIRTLLDYSSGIEGQFFGDFGANPDCLEQYVAACNELRIIHPPAEMRVYNSTGYCIAGRVIECLTGQYFNDALASLLLEPLGISDFAFYDHDVARFRTAVGHGYSENGSYAIDEILRLPHSMSAAGASLSLTARGLLDFGVMHLRDGLTASGERYLGAENILAMRTPHGTVIPDDSELLLGWAALPTNKGRMTVASGRTVGQNSFLFLLPEQNFAMSILANSEMGGEQLFRSLCLKELEKRTGAKINLSALNPPEIQPAETEVVFDPARYVGRFLNSSTVEVLADGDDLSMRLIHESPSTGEQEVLSASMVPIAEDRFGLIPEGAETPVAVAEFLFVDRDTPVASHVSVMKSIYGRI